MIFKGQADDSHFEVTHSHGDPVHIREVIFPILKCPDGKIWEFIGTGFFIAANGLFATARHVIFDAYDAENNRLGPIYIIQWLPTDKFVMRHLQVGTAHPYTDVGIGLPWPVYHPETGEELTTRRLALTAEQPTEGEIIFTYAYPKTSVSMDPEPSIFFNPRYYAGRLEEYYANGRDRVLLPYPCYRTSITMYGGASGGPVFDAKGRVFGLNSKSYETEDGNPNISFVSRITDILDIPLRNVQIDSSAPAPMTILKLARQGHLSFVPPLS
jgi:Trypsin-like peptidase domain